MAVYCCWTLHSQVGELKTLWSPCKQVVHPPTLRQALPPYLTPPVLWYLQEAWMWYPYSTSSSVQGALQDWLEWKQRGDNDLLFKQLVNFTALLIENMCCMSALDKTDNVFKCLFGATLCWFLSQVILTNLSSVNPTSVNGEVLQQSERLKHGDVITIIDRSFRWANLRLFIVNILSIYIYFTIALHCIGKNN